MISGWKAVERDAREDLGLTMRDVDARSKQVASGRSNRAFLIPVSRLSDIERKGTVPSIYKLYTLSLVYKCEMKTLLDLYLSGKRMGV